MSLLESKPQLKITDRRNQNQKDATPVSSAGRVWVFRLFLRIAGCILLATAAGKFASALGNARILDEKDPIFWFLSNRNLILLTASVELAIGLSLLAQRSNSARLSRLLMLCTVFIGYRLSLYFGGFPGPCKCLGAITAAIGLGDEASNRISFGVLTFLSLGAGLGMIALKKGDLLNEND